MKEIWGRDKNITYLLKKQKLDQDHPYKWSQFVLPFESDGKNYLYNTLTRQCVETASGLPRGEVFSFARMENDPELITLAEEYFLVPEQKDEVSFYLSIYQMMRTLMKKKGFTGYMILPTLGCNARCVYCYEKGRHQSSMNSDTIDRTIRFILETRRKDSEIHLSWFGGEPLLRADVIDTVCRAMREKGIVYRSSIITNGSLVSEKTIDQMAGLWKVKKVQISMDCAEQEYRKRKNYFQYENTYRNVIRNAEMIAQQGIRVAIRCNVDEKNIDQIPVFLSDLSAVIKNKTNITAYFAPLFDFQKTPDFPYLWKKILDAKDSVERAGFRSLPDSNLRRLKANFCMADQPSGSAVITPDGDLYTCEHCEPGTSYGNIFQGTTRPEILRGFVEAGTVREKCRNCPLLPECTPFSKCPGERSFCRETGMESMLYALRKRVNTNMCGMADSEDSELIC